MRRSWLFAFAAVMMVIAPALHAQQIAATMSGTVTDPKGGLLQGATITITDENTHSARSTETTKDGTFSVPNLIPSTYTVKAVAQGFAPKALSGLDVHSGDTIRLPAISLAVGATTDTVTVTSYSGQILTTENGQRTATLTYSDIQDIALQTRDTTELLKVLPGVVQTSNNGYNALSTTTGNSALGTGLGVNGAPYKGGMVLNMDGANVIDVGDDFASLATVNPEMTQEVQVQSSNFGADQANGPVVVNTTSRSGGDHYHGEGYFDVRNDVMNANDWSDNHNKRPKGNASYYYPGGSISGPIPHTNKKLFFFGGFELPFQNQGNANSLNFTMATPAMLAGNFSMNDPDNAILCPGGFYNQSSTVGVDSTTFLANTTNPPPATAQGYNEGGWCQNITKDNGNPFPTIFADGNSIAGGGTPVTTYYKNSGGSTVTVTNSAGGIVPSKYIDPNMLAFTKTWPGWNSGYVYKTLADINNNSGNNVHVPIANSDNGWIARGRLDYNWNSTNQLYISYQQSYDSQLASGCGRSFYGGCGGGLQYPGGGIVKKTYSKVLNGHYVHIFSPTLTNEALASWVWGNIPILPVNPSANFRSTLGATFGCFYCVGTTYMPTFGGGTGYPNVGQADDWEPGNYYIVQKAIPTFADNLTKVWGKHTLKFGGMTANTDNYQGNQSQNIQGVLSFGGSAGGGAPNVNFFANLPGGSQCATSVCGTYTGVTGSNNGMVNFLTGSLTNYAESNSAPLSDVAFQTIALYANDQFKVNKKLSVEVGFRFEHIGFWYDRQGTGLAVFYPQRVLPDFYAGKYAPGYYWHGIDSGVPLSGRPDRIGFVSPRFGLSYDVFGNGKTTLRGGWGAYRYQEAANAPQSALNTAQGAVTFNANSVLNNGTVKNATMLVSQIGQVKPFAANCQVACAQAGQTGYDPSNYGLPLTYSYNFTIDQRLPWNMLLDVGYVGNHAMHLSDNFGGNGDGSGQGTYDNLNKTPLYAYGRTIGTGQGSYWQPNTDTFTNRPVCNPENLSAGCNVSGSPSTDADFRPYGKALNCTNGVGYTATPSGGAVPTCTIYGTQGVTQLHAYAYQNYNALQAQIVKRAGPVTLNASLTWSKSLGTEGTFDPFHISTNNSYSNQQRPIVFNSSYIYREPNFWHGNRLVGGAVNGWTISGITLWQQGFFTIPGISIQYDASTLPSYTNQSVTIAGQTYNAGALGISNSSTGVGANTFFGTNAGISTNRPQTTCNPKAGIVTYQIYRPCFTASQFGTSGGQGLHYVAGQAYFENDLALYKTFTIHEQHKVQFRITATNWLNHPLPQFGSNESTTEYYMYDYNTHALKINDRSSSTAPGGNGVGSSNPGSPILASTVNAVSGQKAEDLFGQQHFKSGFGANNQRILELNVKYTF